MPEKRRYFALRLESFEGRDTFLRCGNNQQEFLYCAVVLNGNGRLTIVDNGYRSLKELSKAWTEIEDPGPDRISPRRQSKRTRP